MILIEYNNFYSNDDVFYMIYLIIFRQKNEIYSQNDIYKISDLYSKL